MTDHVLDETVVRGIDVGVPVERAFAVFTEQMTAWWPATHSIGAQPFVDAIVEPRPGGRWYERDADGTECPWGRVLAYEPPSRLVLTWEISADWRHDPDPGHASEIEVRFTATSPTTTRVELEHRGFAAHGAGAEAVRAAVSSEGGWGLILDRYAAAVAG